MASANASALMKVKVALAWCFVGVPLAWGVIKTVANAMTLFQ